MKPSSDLDFLWSLIDKGKNGENIGISTGMPKLDNIIGGIQKNRYLLCGAASSVGKTSFILFIMYNILKQVTSEKPVYFIYYSLEIGADVLLAKLMALYCAEEFGIYLTVNDIFSFRNPLSSHAYECLEKAREWLSNIMEYIVIIDKGLSSKTLYKDTLQFAETLGTFDEEKHFIPNNPNLTIIGIVDHFALVRCEEGRTLKQEIDLMSSYMVTLKRKLPLSWFVLMQQNREASSMDRRKADMSEPTLNDLRDSAGPSNDADLVLQLFFPFREKLSTYRGFKILGDDGIQQNLRSCVITKNRYGVANNVIPMGFWGSVGWFSELPDPKDIVDFTKYRTEYGNIPCKIKQVKEDEIPTKDIVVNKEPLTFSF